MKNCFWTCVFCGAFVSISSLIILIVYGVSLNSNPFTENECILNNKSLGEYNCTEDTYSCIPTKTPELKYIATVKGTNIPRKVYGGKGQTCMCLLLADKYTAIDMPDGLYPLVDINLEKYNAMIIGEHFTCYTDQAGEIYKSIGNNPTINTIQTVIGICSGIISSVIIIICICYCFCKNTKSTKYSGISSIAL